MVALFSLAMLLLLTLAVMLLIGGLDAIDDILGQSVGRKTSGRGKARSRRQGPSVVPETNSPERNEHKPTYPGQTHARPLRAVVGTGVAASDVAGGHSPRDAATSSCHCARVSAAADINVGNSAQEDRRVDVAAVAGRSRKSSTFCGLGDRVKRWVSRLPLGKLKILVVVWLYVVHAVRIWMGVLQLVKNI